MKKFFLLLLIHFILFNVNAQVKISTPGNPDLNAVVELVGTSKGLQLPRLTLTGTSSPSPLPGLTAGMVVNNTVDVSDGYYFSDGMKRIRLLSQGGAWSLSGNAGTTPLANFIGTTDSVGLIMKTNNTNRLSISPIGDVEIGTTGLLHTRFGIGGSTSGDLASNLGLTGTLSATGDYQTLYSIYNAPNFGSGPTPGAVYGAFNFLNYSGSARSYIVADAGQVNVLGNSSHNGIVIGVRGFVHRLSTGSDQAFYGGEFSVLTGGRGSFIEAYSIVGKTFIDGTDSTKIGGAGAQYSYLSISNPNVSLTYAWGIRNEVAMITKSTLRSLIGIQNKVSASREGTVTNAYGSRTGINTQDGGKIINGFGNYLEPIYGTEDITNYSGIYIGNIGLPSGTRRVFEYDGTGTNDPVVINFDGSVQIGTNTPVTNAKLSIVDGHVQTGQTTKPRIMALPTIGAGGTASLIDATDVAGIISIDLGSAVWGSGPIAMVMFDKVYANAPIVVITPLSANASLAVVNQRPFITTNTGSFTINFGAPATSGVVLRFSYHVIETPNN